VEFKLLEADLVVLQQTLFGPGKAVGLSSGRPEVLQQEIQRICKEIGYTFNPAMVSSYGAMKRTLHDLRLATGC
jgi:hypothetical protein